MGDLCADFDSIVDLDGKHLQQGRLDGIRDGKILGLREGWDSGTRHGFNLGSEIGFYAGCALVWKHYADRDPALFSERGRRGISAIQKAIDEFPVLNPGDESLQDRLTALRSKFKAVSAMLGVRYQNEAKEESSAFAF
mmetsp:Transcript_17263/g.23853  ORF Transcript_17263/g.23853 Transcript_17263/m.23853 type:complete len:138 (-) Transcript_17263:39-452(-)|eukprot:CAMPEP_0196579030 /NCGR_PEP_ID=MMETSP1081-20130531/15985_1 /TAXON_ID=36882 /ORGANISM="Pyramimonas amylifera, Strain CCMP720" /LENGTH=137 /DNA_ID=CAMNT_0041898461 /DNA_START=126 /DNA_END=539 /DNA_ORIENTATION=+